MDFLDCIFFPSDLLYLLKMATKEEVKMLWRQAEAVCFDVDSTVIMDEGIDELAAFCGKSDQVKEM